MAAQLNLTRRAPPAACLRLILLLGCGTVLSLRATGQTAPPLFFSKSYMGRCLDFVPPPQTRGAPVFIFDCNKTVAQQVGIEELTPSSNTPAGVGGSGGVVVHRSGMHQVRLHAGSLCIGAASNPPSAGTPLTLQPCAPIATQVLGLDGDSILYDANCNLVAQLKDGVTNSRTPLVCRFSIGDQ